MSAEEIVVSVEEELFGPCWRRKEGFLVKETTHWRAVAAGDKMMLVTGNAARCDP